MLQQRAAPRVMRVLHSQNLLLPVRDRYGDIQWREPNATHFEESNLDRLLWHGICAILLTLVFSARLSGRMVAWPRTMPTSV